MRYLAIVVVLLAATDAFAADKSVAREIPSKELKIIAAIPKGTSAASPSVITSADGLPKMSALGPDSVNALRKQIDFDNEQLVVFWWAGSAADRLDATRETIVEKKTVTGTKTVIERKISVTFIFAPGLAGNSRTHLRLFAVPKGAEVKVETAE
jgi:hypothetical protein